MNKIFCILIIKWVREDGDLRSCMYLIWTSIKNSFLSISIMLCGFRFFQIWNFILLFVTFPSRFSLTGMWLSFSWTILFWIEFAIPVSQCEVISAAQIHRRLSRSFFNFRSACQGSFCLGFALGFPLGSQRAPIRFLLLWSASSEPKSWSWFSFWVAKREVVS
jgi:hypothetical protein